MSNVGDHPDGPQSIDAKKQEPKWKRFEKLAYEIQKEMAGEANVKMDDSIMGFDSKTLRQIDISIRQKIAQYSVLVVIDCKDYKVPVDVKDIEEFAGLVHDVRANKGAMISSNGFTEAALNVARNHGMDTFRMLDTEGIDWKTYVAVPVLLERVHLEKYSMGFRGVAPFLLPSSKEGLADLELHSDDGTRLGTVKDILRSKWDKQEIPHRPGVYDVLVGKGVVVKFQGVKSKLDCTSTVVVGRKYYLGPLPVRVKGFEDVQTGGIITKELRTEALEPGKIERGEVPGWTEIMNPEELSVKVMFQVGYDDLYTDDAKAAERQDG